MCFCVRSLTVPYIVRNVFGIKQFERNIFLKDEAVSISCCAPYLQVYEFMLKKILSQLKGIFGTKLVTSLIHCISPLLHEGSTYSVSWHLLKLTIMWNTLQSYVRFEFSWLWLWRLRTLRLGQSVVWWTSTRHFCLIIFVCLVLFSQYENLKKKKGGILWGYIQSHGGIIWSSCYNLKFVELTSMYFINPLKFVLFEMLYALIFKLNLQNKEDQFQNFVVVYVSCVFAQSSDPVRQNLCMNYLP
jgi:hypothetical protein